MFNTRNEEPQDPTVTDLAKTSKSHPVSAAAAFFFLNKEKKMLTTHFCVVSDVAFLHSKFL